MNELPSRFDYDRILPKDRPDPRPGQVVDVAEVQPGKLVEAYEAEEFKDKLQVISDPFRDTRDNNDLFVVVRYRGGDCHYAERKVIRLAAFGIVPYEGLNRWTAFSYWLSIEENSQESKMSPDPQ